MIEATHRHLKAGKVRDEIILYIVGGGSFGFHNGSKTERQIRNDYLILLTLFAFQHTCKVSKFLHARLLSVIFNLFVILT